MNLFDFVTIITQIALDLVKKIITEYLEEYCRYKLRKTRTNYEILDLFQSTWFTCNREMHERIKEALMGSLIYGFFSPCQSQGSRAGLPYSGFDYEIESTRLTITPTLLDARTMNGHQVIQMIFQASIFIMK